jgi:polyhydroxybutyrate depolymerase
MGIRGQRLAGALLVAILSAAGCGERPTPNVSKGTSVQTIEVDGQTREFRVFRPETLPEAAPLVVVMHGWGFTAEQIEADYGWNELAAKQRFIIAYPEGVGQSFNAAGECCGPAAERDVDDFAFITGLIERLEQKLPIDDKRIYAAGFSNGGVLAYALACRTSMFAAIAAVAATQVGTCEDPRPTSIIHVHGLADQLVRYDGGPAVVPGARAVPSVMRDWLRINDCEKPERSRDGAVAVARAECAGGREVTLVLITDEDHLWPGHAGSTSEWDATRELWTMLSRHSR